MAVQTPSDATPDHPPDEAPAPRARRTPFGLSPMLLVSTVIGSLAVAVLVAMWIVPDDDNAGDDVVSVEDIVGGELRTSVEGTARKGRPAPPTSFEYLNGGSGTLDEFAGRPVVLNFWASSCAPCLKEMPAFERLHQGQGDEIVVLGVDVSEGVEPGREMVERTGVTYPQARDPQGDLLRAYGGIQLPHTVVIDADGVVTELRNKVLDDDDIRALVAPLTQTG